jgi:hypothetical protein
MQPFVQFSVVNFFTVNQKMWEIIMRKNRNTLSRVTRLSAAISLIAGSAVVYGQGNVDGYIVGEVNGASGPVSGAEVTIRSLDTGATRTLDTSDLGGYRFSRLPTGRYEVRVSAPGMGTSVQEVVVNVGQGTPANFDLQRGSGIEEIVVTGDLVAPVDTTSAETTTVITAIDLGRLPVPRDINAVALMAPGAVYGDARFGALKTGSSYGSNFGLASFGGASVAENAYFINGMNVTNFRNGLGGSSIPFEFYDQVQLKTGGYGAEFGRSTGGVLNAVTKRGTNDWNIRAGYYVTPKGLQSNAPDVPDPTNGNEFDQVFSYDTSESTEAFISAGGPIIKDKLFVYGLYNYRDNKEDNYTGGGQLYQERDDDPFWGAKVDWLINDDHSLEYTGWTDKRDQVRNTFDWDESRRVVGADLGETLINRGGDNHILKYTGNFGDNFTVALLGGKSKNNLTTAAPSDEACPLAYDSRGGGLDVIGCWTNSLPEAGEDTRKVWRADFEWAINDSHILRFGADSEKNTSSSNRFYSGHEYFRYFLADPGEELSNGGIVPAGANEIVRYRVLEGGGSFTTYTESFYIEDEWRVNDDITVRLGLRNERFDNRNSAGGTFIKITDQFAPRVGIAWDVNGDGSSKFFANFGRYHLPIASNTNIRLAGSELFTEEWFALAGAIQSDGSVALGEQIGPTTTFSDGSVPDVREVIDTTIKPMYQDEFIIGYETELMDDWVGSVNYVYRNLGEGIEDVTIDAAINSPGEFHYILTNPGTDVTTYYDADGDGVAEELNLTAEQMGFDPMTRKYHALNFTLEKSFRNGLYLKGIYTWSHSYGNSEGYVRSDNGQDDAGLTTLYDFPGLNQGAHGDLPNDRRHQLKLFGAYDITNDWQVNFAAVAMTGRPLNSFGVHPTDDFAALYGAESFFNQGVFTPRGSQGRTPKTLTIDVGTKYVMDVGDSTLTFRADVFNLLDADKVTQFQETADEESGVASSTYGLPYRFQSPRYVRMGVTWDFNM